MKVPQYLVGAVLLYAAVLLPLHEASKREATWDEEYSYTYDYKPPDLRFLCYHCQYFKILGFGEPGCDDPFNRRGVLEEKCNSSCAKTISWFNGNKSSDDYLITRSCLNNCRNQITDNKEIRCCSTSLCNAFSSSLPLKTSCFCITLYLAISALLTSVIFSKGTVLV